MPEISYINYMIIIDTNISNQVNKIIMQHLSDLRINFMNVEEVLATKFKLISQHYLSITNHNIKNSSKIQQLQSNYNQLSYQFQTKIQQLQSKLLNQIDKSPIPTKQIQDKTEQQQYQQQQYQISNSQGPENPFNYKENHEAFQLLDKKNKGLIANQQYQRFVIKYIESLEKKIEEVERVNKGYHQINLKKYEQTLLEIRQKENLLNQSIKVQEEYIKKVESLSTDLIDFRLKQDLVIQKLGHGSDLKNVNINHKFDKIVINRLKVLSTDVMNCLRAQDFTVFKEQIQKNFKIMHQQIQDKLNIETYNNIVKYIDYKLNDQKRKISSNKTSLLGNSFPEFTIAIQKQIQILKNNLMNIERKIIDLESSDRNLRENQKKIMEKSEETEEKLIDIQESFKNYLDQFNKTYENKIEQYQFGLRQIKEKLESEEKQKIITRSQSILHQNQDLTSRQLITKEDTKITQVMKTEIQNDMLTMNKKLNKLSMKFLQQKEEVMKFFEDVKKELDVYKNQIEKKVDNQTVRKNFMYIESKLNQIISNISNTNNSQQSLAAKKNWTCLCCDKIMDKYQGRLGEVKLSNIFPQRFESPRLGGYFKQNIQDRQYRKVYLNSTERKNQLPNVSSKN